VDNVEALEFLAVALGSGGQGFHALTYSNGSNRRTKWLPVKDYARFLHVVPELAWEADAELTVCPLMDRGSYRLAADAGVIWTRVESRKAAASLARFRPSPSLVLREGGSVRRVAVWAVRKRLSPMDAEKVGRHLAHKLGTAKKWASTAFTLRPPGGVIRHGRTRPCPVVVEGGSLEAVTMRELCRSLPRRLPDPDAWRK
jgi:hypothetical protein